MLSWILVVMQKEFACARVHAHVYVCVCVDLQWILAYFASYITWAGLKKLINLVCPSSIVSFLANPGTFYLSCPIEQHKGHCSYLPIVLSVVVNKALCILTVQLLCLASITYGSMTLMSIPVSQMPVSGLYRTLSQFGSDPRRMEHSMLDLPDMVSGNCFHGESPF